MATSPESLLIVCVGNPSRGDDAVGPLIACRLQETAPALTVIETFQLQPEMVEDLAGHTHVIIVDAQANASAALTLRRITPAHDLGWCSHALSPEQLAGLFQTAFRQPAPDMLAIGLKAESFELGAPLSPQALALIPVVSNTLVDLHARLQRDFMITDVQGFLHDSFATVQAHA